METIFFSGGNGFLGRNFIESCQDFYHIDAPGRSQLELTDQAQVDAYFANKKYDCLINGASVAVTRKSQLQIDSNVALNANLRAFANLYKNRESAKRFIQLGSGAEYGRPLSRRQIEEEYLGEHLPTDDYGFGKWIASRIIAGEAPATAVNLHLFGTFGPHEDYQVRFISHAIVRILSNLPIVMNQNVEFDYMYVKDFIKILREFITRPASYSSYNISAGMPMTLLEIAEMVREILGSKQDIFIKNPGLGHQYTGSNERLRLFLGPDFKFTPIKKAIEELAVWYESRLTDLNQEWIINSV